MKNKRKQKSHLQNKWKQLSREIRDKVGQCEICGSKEHLCVHHILEKRMHKELLFEEHNLICLCSKCHFKLHHHRSFEFHAWLSKNKHDQFVWLTNWLYK